MDAVKKMDNVLVELLKKKKKKLVMIRVLKKV